MIRLVRLELFDFQSVGHSCLEFGPGLNIVFGPNDFGKSTMATAVRAALLVPAGSAESDRFRPWQKDASPRVILTIVDKDQKYWKVDKTFGRTGSSAELYFSKDGVQFSLDVKARQVDEHLRKLLSWGIPAPGGKGGTKGLPTSFLSNALLGEQEDIDRILSQSIKEDSDETGRVSLQAGLSTLGQDPAFKVILGRVQREVDTYFTATGRRKGGQGSIFVDIRDRLNKAGREIADLRRKVEDARQVEESLERLRAQQDQAREAHSAALAVLEGKQAMAARVTERDEAAEALATTQAELGKYDARAETLKNKRQELEGAKLRLSVTNDQSVQLRALMDQGVADVDAAKAALQLAQSADGAGKIELEKAQLSTEIALLEQRLGKAQGRAVALADVQATGDLVVSTREQLVAKEAELQQVSDALKAAVLAVEGALSELAPVQLCRAYARFRVARGAKERTVELRRGREQNQSALNAKTSEIGAVGDETKQITQERDALLVDLPSESELREAETIHHQIEVVQAALGGGATVTLRRRGDVAVRMGADGAPPTALEVSAEPAAVELERHAIIEVGELLSIEITAGAAEKRREFEALSLKWQAKGAPLLDKAKLGSLAAVRARLTQGSELTAKLQELAARETRLKSELNQLAGRVDQEAQQIAELDQQALPLEALEAQLAGKDLGALEKIWLTLSANWEGDLDAREKAAVAAVEQARAAHANAVSAVSVAKVKAEQASVELKRTEVDWAQRAQAVGLPEGTDARLAIQSNEAEVAEMDRSRTALRTRSTDLAASSTQAVTAAEAALAVASNKRDDARTAAETCDQELATARSLVDVLQGEANAMSELVNPEERITLTERLAAKAAHFALFADVSANAAAELDAAEQGVAQAQGALQSITSEFDEGRGALTKVTGIATKEELTRAEEAKQRLEQEQELAELDADAWQFLRETMREVENEQGAHLGRSLAGPVTASFANLTGGRYGDLTLDTNLVTTGIGFLGGTAEGKDVLQALSVGTRNQLATLLRLTIAEQLKSSIILDDQLVNTDEERLTWFYETLRKVALKAQVIVLTCRPRDYLSVEQMPVDVPFRDLAGGATRAIDVTRVVQR